MWYTLKKVHEESSFSCAGKNISLVLRKIYAENKTQRSRYLRCRKSATTLTSEVRYA